MHERGYSVKLGADGEPRFTNRHGIALPNVPRPPPPSNGETLPTHHRRRGLTIDQKTLRDGDGDRLNHADGVDAIRSAVNPPDSQQA